MSKPDPASRRLPQRGVGFQPPVSWSRLVHRSCASCSKQSLRGIPCALKVPSCAVGPHFEKLPCVCFTCPRQVEDEGLPARNSVLLQLPRLYDGLGSTFRCCRIVKPVSPKKTRVTLHDGRQRHLEASDATESGFSKAYRCDSKRGNQVVAMHSTKYELHVRMPCWQNMGVR